VRAVLWCQHPRYRTLIMQPSREQSTNQKGTRHEKDARGPGGLPGATAAIDSRSALHRIPSLTGVVALDSGKTLCESEPAAAISVGWEKQCASRLDLWL
jgi:hypothetical protein